MAIRGMFDDLDEFLGCATQRSVIDDGSLTQDISTMNIQPGRSIGQKKSTGHSDNWFFNSNPDLESININNFNGIGIESTNIRDSKKLLDDILSDKEIDYSDDESNLNEKDNETNKKDDLEDNNDVVNAIPSVTILTKPTSVTNLASTNSWDDSKNSQKMSKDYQKVVSEKINDIKKALSDQSASVSGVYKAKFDLNLADDNNNNSNKLLAVKSNSRESFPSLKDSGDDINIKSKPSKPVVGANENQQFVPQDPFKSTSYTSSKKYNIKIPTQANVPTSSYKEFTDSRLPTKPSSYADESKYESGSSKFVVKSHYKL